MRIVAEYRVNSAVCRDCGARFAAAAAGPCPACGARRVITHPELFGLTIAHLDCDAFYAAIEKRDDPSLADRPVIVGGGVRGVVTTACYIARTYGVRSAMPMFKALKACPDAVVIRPDFTKYSEAARAVRALMERATPLVEPVSIDEAFLDLAGTERLHGRAPAETMLALQGDIKREIGITVSIGLSANKFLAKLASDLDKPEGFSVIGLSDAAARLAPMPVTAIWGVGAVFAKKLAADGFRVIADLQRADASFLRARYGDMGARLAELSHGKDNRAVSVDRETKSVSAETTFNADIADRAELEAILWTLCERTSARMKAKGFIGRTATLKLKTTDFDVITRSRQLPEASNLAHTLFDATQPLLAAAPRVSYRLIGAGYSDLATGEAAPQASLFGDANARHRREEAAVDAIREKFGANAIAFGRAHAAIKLKRGARKDKAESDGSD
jgi:DNA polymerase-4